MRKTRRFVLCLAALQMSLLAQGQLDAARPRLQILNGSQEPIEVFWISDDTEQIPQAVIQPCRNTVITTSIGHRFAVVGKTSRTEAIVTSKVAVQGFRFDPANEQGVPKFYTQRLDADHFPIVASAKVNC